MGEVEPESVAISVVRNGLLICCLSIEDRRTWGSFFTLRATVRQNLVLGVKSGVKRRVEIVCLGNVTIQNT